MPRHQTRLKLPWKRRQHLIHLLPPFRRSFAFLVAACVHAIASCFTANMDAKTAEENDAAAAADMGAGGVDKEEEVVVVQQNEGPPRHRHAPSNIFILAGQSNMSGRGGVQHKRWDRVVPLQCHSSPAILRFSAGSHWVEARAPLHADIDTGKACGVGPGLPFAHAVLPHLLPHDGAAAPVGLVPCAVGGTAIREWERGTRLYEQMVRRAKAAVRGGGVVRAVLWYQGESDTHSSHAADAYGANMEKLIRDVRADLGLPSLPFIQVAIASGDVAACIEKVRQAQLGMDLPNVVCVDAMGLPLSGDHLHLTTEAQVRLGGMLAEAYIKHFVAIGAVAQASDPPPPLPSCH